MKLSRMFALASVCCLGLVAAPVFAADGAASDIVAADGKKTCNSKTCADKLVSTDAATGVCPAACAVQTAMAKLPKMTFLVGDQEICCSKSAAALAKTAEEPIQYKVGDETFESQEKAFTTLVTKTEAMVAAFTTPSTCKISGKTTIAGKSSQCSVEAGTMAKKVQEATQLVSMKYKVGKETCTCPNSAKALAKKAGVTPTYVVNGTETPCEMTARLTLARAKYEAAVKALASTAEAADVGSES